MFLIKVVDSKRGDSSAFVVLNAETKRDAKRALISHLRIRYPNLCDSREAARWAGGVSRKAPRERYCNHKTIFSALSSAAKMRVGFTGVEPCVARLLRHIFLVNAGRFRKKKKESSKYLYWRGGASLGMHQLLHATQLIEVAPGVFSLTGD